MSSKNYIYRIFCVRAHFYQFLKISKAIFHIYYKQNHVKGILLRVGSFFFSGEHPNAYTYIYMECEPCTVSIAKYLCCCFVLFGLRRAVSSEMRHSSLNHRPTLYRFCVILCASAGGFLCVFRLLISHAQPEFFNQISDRHAFPSPTISRSLFLSENERTNKNINRTAQMLVQCVCAMCISDSYYLGTCFSGPIYFF